MRYISLAIATLMLLGSAGCFTFDRRHNRRHIKYIKQDLREIHKDIDKFLGTDKASGLRDVEHP